MTLGNDECTSCETLAVELEAFGLLAAAFEGTLDVGVLAAEGKLVIAPIPVILLRVDGAVNSIYQLARAQLKPSQRARDFPPPLRAHPQEEVC